MKVAKAREGRGGRYEVKQHVLLFNRDNFAEIVDIDEHGATCRALTDIETMESLDMDIELLNCDAGMHVKGITCRIVVQRDGCITSQKNVENTCTLEFPDLSRQKRKELEMFIKRSCFGGMNTGEMH